MFWGAATTRAVFSLKTGLNYVKKQASQNSNFNKLFLGNFQRSFSRQMERQSVGNFFSLLDTLLISVEVFLLKKIAVKSWFFETEGKWSYLSILSSWFFIFFWNMASYASFKKVNSPGDKVECLSIFDGTKKPCDNKR